MSSKSTMRRMYTLSEIHAIAANEVGKLDKELATGISGSGDILLIVHDGKPLSGTSERVHLKQLFGKYSLIGEGNIDLFHHYLKLSSRTGANAIYLDFVSSSNLVCDSIQDVNELFGATAKTIPLGGSDYISWIGKYVGSKYYLNGTEAALSLLINVQDVVEVV